MNVCYLKMIESDLKQRRQTDAFGGPPALELPLRMQRPVRREPGRRRTGFERTGCRHLTLLPPPRMIVGMCSLSEKTRGKVPTTGGSPGECNHRQSDKWPVTCHPPGCRCCGGLQQIDKSEREDMDQCDS
jgi:hypothetical protein